MTTQHRKRATVSTCQAILVAGARPNFVKLAALHHALTKRPHLRTMIVHTGQHYDDDLSGSFFRELDVPIPDVNLEVGAGSHAEQTGTIMIRFEPVLRRLGPQWVVVFGDVNSTVACALVAAKLGVRVAHVEAGLRSFAWTMPEDINRVLTDRLSDRLYAPSRDACSNLAATSLLRCIDRAMSIIPQSSVAYARSSVAPQSENQSSSPLIPAQCDALRS